MEQFAEVAFVTGQKCKLVKKSAPSVAEAAAVSSSSSSLPGLVVGRVEFEGSGLSSVITLAISNSRADIVVTSLSSGKLRLRSSSDTPFAFVLPGERSLSIHATECTVHGTLLVSADMTIEVVGGTGPRTSICDLKTICVATGIGKLPLPTTADQESVVVGAECFASGVCILVGKMILCIDGVLRADVFSVDIGSTGAVLIGEGHILSLNVRLSESVFKMTKGTVGNATVLAEMGSQVSIPRVFGRMMTVLTPGVVLKQLPDSDSDSPSPSSH
jgi:hypothetical protein